MKTHSQESSTVERRVTRCAPVFADGYHDNTARRGLTRPTCITIFFLMFGFVTPLHAQYFSLDWYVIAGGGVASTSGGSSTGSTYQVSGTIGQPGASGPLTNAQFSVTGGYWSFITVVPTVGAPTLTISHADNIVKVSWPYPSTDWTLQQTPNLAAANWSASSGITNDGTNNVITLTSPTGKLFFRLSHQ